MEPKAARRSNANTNKRTPPRKPLSDCINTLHFKNPSQSSTSSTKNPSSFTKPSEENDISSPSNPSVVSVHPISTPSPATKPSSLEGNDTASHEGFKSRSVYTRRHSAEKRKGKQKAIAEPMSCFPALKTHSARNEMNEGAVINLSKSCILPYKKKRRQTTPKEDDDKHALPQDFIDKQRAYFAEIDAFELPEEEVASIDELD